MEEVQKAIKVLKNGGIVIFPTDTAFGIGCRIDNEASVKRLFKLRRRAETKAVPVLVSGIEMAKKYWKEVPAEVVKKLIKPYWPGGLTIILPCKSTLIPSLVRGGGDTIGLRMPDNSITVDVIKAVGVPIIGTSANFAGEKTPYDFQDLDPELLKLVDFVLKPNNFESSKNKNLASTVIDCTSDPWQILRQGAVKVKL